MEWQPGDVTAVQMQDEWVEEHGWTVQPSDAVLAVWREVAAAEAEYQREAQAAAPTPETPAAEVGSPQIGSARVGSGLPELLVVPAHPRPDGTRGVEVELAVSGGSPVVVGFSTVDALVAMLGEHQPWVALAAADVAAVHAGLPIVVDPTSGVIDAQWSSDRLNALRKVVSGE